MREVQAGQTRMLEMRAEQQVDACHTEHRHLETIPVVDAVSGNLSCYTLPREGAVDVVDFGDGRHAMVRSAVCDMVNATLTLTSTSTPAFARNLEQAADCVNAAAAAVRRVVSVSANETENAVSSETTTVTWNVETASPEAEISSTIVTSVETRIFSELACAQLTDFLESLTASTAEYNCAEETRVESCFFSSFPVTETKPGTS